jgi:hypothetical protein
LKIELPFIILGLIVVREFSSTCENEGDDEDEPDGETGFFKLFLNIAQCFNTGINVGREIKVPKGRKSCSAVPTGLFDSTTIPTSLKRLGYSQKPA